MSLAISDVSLTFPDGQSSVEALKSVSLAAEPGTVTAITGPSGSGKSTLLAVASTLRTPDSGSVKIDDEEVSQLNDRERARIRRDKVGIMFQQSNLLPALTAREQLLVTQILGGSSRSKSELEQEADQLLKDVGVDDRSHARPGRLSGGQRQRVNLARALMGNPSLLVIDEPTSALDRERGALIIDLILRLTRARNIATLLVTHDLQFLSQMDAHYEMMDGILTNARAREPLLVG